MTIKINTLSTEAISKLNTKDIKRLAEAGDNNAKRLVKFNLFSNSKDYIENKLIEEVWG